MTAQTRQQQFNQIVTVAKKGERSFDDLDTTRCLYRLQRQDGSIAHCFVGALLPDQLLIDLHLKGVSMASTIQSLCYDSPQAAEILGVTDVGNPYDARKSFLLKLQEIHDMASPTNWKQRLRSFADRYELSLPQDFEESWVVEQE